MMIDTYLTAQQVMEQTGLSAAELAALPMGEYARLSNRPTFGQTAAQAHGYSSEPGTPAPPPPTQHEQPAPREPDSTPAQIPAPRLPDFASMSLDQYAVYREQAGVGQGAKEGRGIFDSVGSRSQTYADAVRAQTGRGALSSGNVTPAPQLTGRHVRQGDMRDQRTAGQRFSSPSNAFNL